MKTRIKIVENHLGVKSFHVQVKRFNLFEAISLSLITMIVAGCLVKRWWNVKKIFNKQKCAFDYSLSQDESTVCLDLEEAQELRGCYIKFVIQEHSDRYAKEKRKKAEKELKKRMKNPKVTYKYI